MIRATGALIAEYPGCSLYPLLLSFLSLQVSCRLFSQRQYPGSRVRGVTIRRCDSSVGNSLNSRCLSTAITTLPLGSVTLVLVRIIIVSIISNNVILTMALLEYI